MDGEFGRSADHEGYRDVVSTESAPMGEVKAKLAAQEVTRLAA
jgi:hypothetical protein